jgi:Arc/MetJ-type ribon-helix-helix transcriptional regulator
MIKIRKLRRGEHPPRSGQSIPSTISKNGNLRLISVYISSADLKAIEVLIDREIFKDRAEFIRCAIRNELEYQIVLGSERKKLENYYDSKLKNRSQKRK